MDYLKAIRVVLIDIEGTITPISFVKEELFGYVRNNLRCYLENKFDEEIVQCDIKDLLEESKETENGFNMLKSDKNEVIKKVEDIVIRWMDTDKKYSSLKKLQGHMFQEAFNSNSVVTDLYPDVLKCMRKLKKMNKKICIYSSGSVFAQKLLFSHTVEGNMSGLISAYYDTSVGAKVEAESYKKICLLENVEPREVLFLTDLIKETKAASIAGCGVGVMVRPGNQRIADEDMGSFKSYTSLEELFT